MKILIAGLVVLLAIPSVAAADDEALPPRGPVYREPPTHRLENGQQRNHRRARMRAVMVARFDANGDGRLQPNERKRAKQAIRAKRMQRMERLIQRFDTNRDGNVGPAEMPPGAANKLRRLDRNGDGWVQPGERRGR